MVLQFGDDGDVPRAEVVEAPRVGHEIDALRCAVREDQLARLRRIHELRDLLAGAFVLRGCDLRKRVDAAMDVRVGGLVEVAQLVEHLARFVRADRGVEVGERLAADLLLEDGKIGAELACVELRLGCYGHPAIVPGGFYRKRTSALVALAFVSVTLNDLGKR